MMPPAIASFQHELGEKIRERRISKSCKRSSPRPILRTTSQRGQREMSRLGKDFAQSPEHNVLRTSYILSSSVEGVDRDSLDIANARPYDETFQLDVKVRISNTFGV